MVERVRRPRVARASDSVKVQRATVLKDRKPTVAEAMNVMRQLKERDRHLVQWLYQVQYASTDQVRRLFYDEPDEPADKQQRDCWRRLWELGKLGVLANLPIDQRHRVWMLDENGIMAAEELLEVPEHHRLNDYTKRATGPMQLDHHVAVTEVNAQLRLLIGWTYWRWQNSLAPLYYELPDPRRRVPGRYLRPDADLLMEIQGGGYRTLYLEVDMGTERDPTIEAKLVAYDAADKLGWDYAKDDRPAGVVPHHEHGIVFACATAKRAQEIQAMMDRHVHLVGLSVTLEEAAETIASFGSRRAAYDAERKRRRDEAEQRKKATERADAAKRIWAQYDQELAAHLALEQQYISDHKSWFKNEQKCQAEFQAANPPPAKPKFGRPAV